jgi:hypothetical protein
LGGIFLVVAALAPVLRGLLGRNPGANDDTTRHLLGRSVRVLAFGLAFEFAASRMTTRERAAGNEFWILPLDTGCGFSSEFVIIQDDAKLRNPLIFKAGMTGDDSRKQH